MKTPDKEQAPQTDETLPGMIRRAMELKGLRSIKKAAEYTKISVESFRILLNRGHVPKNRILHQVARSLELDLVRVVIAAQKQLIPQLARENMLTPVEAAYGEKRIWPLSQEQCEYLAKVLQPEEIQFIRKFRQVTAQGKIQIRGFVDFEYDAFRRSRAAAAPQETPPAGEQERMPA